MDSDRNLRDTSLPADADTEMARAIGGGDPFAEANDPSLPADADTEMRHAIQRDEGTLASDMDELGGADIDVAQGLTGYLGAGDPASRNPFDDV